MQIIHLTPEADLNFGSVNMLILPINFLGEDLMWYFLKRSLVKGA